MTTSGGEDYTDMSTLSYEEQIAKAMEESLAISRYDAERVLQEAEQKREEEEEEMRLAILQSLHTPTRPPAAAPVNEEDVELEKAIQESLRVLQLQKEFEEAIRNSMIHEDFISSTNYDDHYSSYRILEERPSMPPSYFTSNTSINNNLVTLDEVFHISEVVNNNNAQYTQEEDSIAVKTTEEEQPQLYVGECPQYVHHNNDVTFPLVSNENEEQPVEGEPIDEETVGEDLFEEGPEDIVEEANRVLSDDFDDDQEEVESIAGSTSSSIILETMNQFNELIIDDEEEEDGKEMNKEMMNKDEDEDWEMVQADDCSEKILRDNLEESGALSLFVLDVDEDEAHLHTY